MADGNATDDPRRGGFPRHLRTVVVYTVRIALAACVVGLGVWALAGLSALRERTLTPPGPPTQNATMPSADWLAPADLQGGGWTLAGLPWQVLMKNVTQGDVEKALLIEPSGSQSSKAPDEQEKELLRLIRLLAPGQRQLSDLTLYDVNLQGLRIVLFTTGRGTDERLLLVRLAFQKEGGQGASWLLVEATPAPPADQPAGTVAELLPLPAGFRRLATRLGENGTVIAEVVSVDGGPETLRELWQRSGYRMESLSGKAGPGITCIKDQKAMQAWFWQSQDGRGPTLVMVIALKLR